MTLRTTRTTALTRNCITHSIYDVKQAEATLALCRRVAKALQQAAQQPSQATAALQLARIPQFEISPDRRVQLPSMQMQNKFPTISR